MNKLGSCLWEAAKATDNPKHYSQATLSRKLNVSRESVSSWVQNKYQPTKRNRNLVLKYLNKALPDLTMEDLFYTETVTVYPKN